MKTQLFAFSLICIAIGAYFIGVYAHSPNLGIGVGALVEGLVIGMIAATEK